MTVCLFVRLSVHELHDSERQQHANARPSHTVDSQMIVYC